MYNPVNIYNNTNPYIMQLVKELWSRIWLSNRDRLKFSSCMLRWGWREWRSESQTSNSPV